MSKERECAEYLRAIVGKEPFQTCVAIVKSVDGATCTVERVFDGMEITDVRLNCSSTENSGIVITPKEESHVLITSIDGRYWFVSQFSSIDGITIDSESPIVINGGSNHGLIQIDKLTQKLNELVNAFNNHTHSGDFEGTIANAPATGSISLMQPTQHPQFDKSDYEDTNVTH